MFKLNERGRFLLTLSMLLIALLSLSACSNHLMQKQLNKEVKKNEANQYHEFVAVGYAAIAAQKGETDDVKMLNAIKASKIEAYKELAEQIHGIMLTSENSIEQHQLQDEVLEVKVTGLVRGAKVLRTYHEGDLYITELGLTMKTLPNTNYADFSSLDEVIHVDAPIYY